MLLRISSRGTDSEFFIGAQLTSATLVPEPSGTLPLAAGTLGLLVRRRR